MSNYSVLKQDINNNIYENQTQQITGTVLNAILNEMTTSLGAGYQFAGVATLGMNPGDPDQRVFYLAGEGIYTNFGGLQVPAGKLGVLKWDNRWTLQTIDGLGGGGANLTGYVSLASTDDLPDEGQPTIGYLCGTNLYLYVGEGGDTKEGKYQDCGSFRGPQGDSVQDVEQTQTSLENGGVNKIKFTLSNGVSCEFQVRNGTTSSGLFPTVEALQAAYPSPVVGQYAFVGSGFPADIYVCTTAGTWTDSGEDYDGDNVDLTDYATKAEVNQLEAEVGKIICQGNTTVSRYHTLRANRTYTVRLSKADWSVTNVSDTIFLIRYYKANNTTTDVVRISQAAEATRVLEYYFTAPESAIRYEILFRGNVGEEFYYYITDAGEPSLKLSPAFGNYTLFFDNANGKVIVKDGSMNFPRIGSSDLASASYKGVPQNTQISYGFSSSTKYYSLFADIVNGVLVIGGSVDNPQKTFGLLLIAFLHTSDYSTVDWVLTNCHYQISDAGTSEDDLAIQAFLGKTATLYGSKYITNDGTVSNASSWETYMFDVVPGEVYKVESWFNTIGSSDSTKKQWVIVSKKLAVGESFTSGEIVSAGDSFGGSVIGKQFWAGYVVDKVTIPSGGKTLLVMKGDGETDAPAIERILPGQKIQIDKSVIKIKNGKPKPVTFIKPGFGILNFTSCSKSTGAETIVFFVGYFYKSPSFVFGGVNHYRNQQWRVPCIEGQFLSIRPSSNGTVTIKDFSGVFSSAKTWTGAGMRLDAHLGFQTVAPENSAVAFELAAMCGYPACIVNPIASADGTLYCYHEDDNVLSYGGARTSLSAASFALKTDAELEDYTVIGSSALAGLYGEPIPTLKEFFEICGRTGMRPMFSTHPALTTTQWNEVKAMLLKYGLLKWFTVKSFDISTLETAYGIFGDEIDGYIYDVSTNNVDGHIQAIQESEMANAKRIGIEYPENVITKEICEKVIAEGYFVSIWSVGLITGQRYYDLAEMGVSEVTDDNNGSCGLNY